MHFQTYFTLFRIQLDQEPLLNDGAVDQGVGREL